MKALITAGGHATRLRPITWTINKHLIPLANKPMIFNAIEKIAETGVKDIGININPGETEMQKVVGTGSRWGVSITYIEQVGGPKGLAHILKIAQSFLGDEDFIFYLGDNIILGSITQFVNKFKQEKPNGLLALSKVRDPQRFGVPEIRDGKIIRVDEKPQNPKSDFAVTGIYIYDHNIFHAVDAIKPSARGEYEISDAHTWLIENGYNIGHQEITGWWKDTGKPEDLLEGNQLLLAEMTREQAINEGECDPEVIINGRVKIGRGTVVRGRTLIRGPVTIGENCIIESSYIGPYTAIGSNAIIRNTEIEHSIIFDQVTVSCSKRIVDGLIGRGATIISAADSLPAGHRMVIGDNSTVEL
ncbi:glucose-1-phosphate thymidylyltransferase [Patescibacteria group bacterium]|nr:glucose-1-phosphate thymidylyltransferase [Patescibacteria group bacterium]MBU1029547.1 glucose-1-phosphate thymidylyltransferase [Patescibacteria group bacterium]MBU1915545.1 glucose-1-phosphate thymidylyltransferase [Patescibacteria group bacterium]